MKTGEFKVYMSIMSSTLCQVPTTCIAVIVLLTSPLFVTEKNIQAVCFGESVSQILQEFSNTMQLKLGHKCHQDGYFSNKKLETLLSPLFSLQTYLYSSKTKTELINKKRNFQLRKQENIFSEMGPINTALPNSIRKAGTVDVFI